MAHGTITAGSGSATNNATCTPVNPAHASGDTLLCVAVVRSTTATLSCSTTGWADADGITNPTGFTGARLYLFQNECDSAAESNPGVAISGGSNGGTVSAAVLRLQNRDFAQNFSIGASSTPGTSTSTITFGENSPSIDVGNAIIAIGYIGNDYTTGPGDLSGQTAGLTWSEIVDFETTQGSDQTITVDYAINDSGSAYTAGTGATKSGGSWASAAVSAVYLESVGAATGAVLVAASGSYSITGTASALQRSRIMPASTASYSITGTAAALARGRPLTAAAGSYSISGTAAVFNRAYILAANAGSYAISGTAAVLAQGYKLAADTAAYAVTGTAAALVRGKALTAEAGSYAITGTAAVFLRGRVLAAAAGSYAITGAAAALNWARVLVASSGSYAITGAAATLARSRILAAAPASYAISGAVALLAFGRKLMAAAGSYILTGTDVALTYTSVPSLWQPTTPTSGSWSDTAEGSGTWTPIDPTIGSWE